MSLPLAESMTRAASLAIAGKKEEALAELCRARSSGLESPKLSSAIGHLQFEFRQFQAAAHAYEEALRVDASDSAAHYNRGVCLEKLAEWDNAAEAFEKAIELDSRRASAYLGLGISRLHLERYEEALSAFEKCLERQPFREAALCGKAVALHHLERRQEAAEIYQKLLARDSRSEELLGNLISLAMADGDWELLGRTAAWLLEIQPVSAIGLEAAALAKFARHEFDAAFRSLSTLVEAHPDHFAGWFNSGLALQKLGFHERAAEAYSRAASLDPRSAEAFASLGTALQEAEQWEQAEEAYLKALELAPHLHEALWNLALVYEHQKDLRRAQTLYCRLVEHDADAQEAWFRLGYVRLLLGDLPASIRAFEACLALPRACPEALLNIGIAYWKMRNLDMAKETFRHAAGSNLKSAALHFLGAIALEQQDYEQALTLHKQLLEIEGPTSELLYNLALLFQKRGRAAEAVRYYRQALALRADFPEAQLNLGHALMSLGRHEEAKAAWQTVLTGSTEIAEKFLV